MQIRLVVASSSLNIWTPEHASETKADSMHHLWRIDALAN